MKRIISLILVSLLVLSAFFCLAGCGKVNKSEVAILWRGDASVTDPNSLINSMERAMYINKVEYKHYGANYKEIKQYEQAKEALNNGAQVLVVELVNQFSDLGNSLAQQIIDAAREKNVPVIFFNSFVKEELLQSYDKCASVMNNISSISEVQGELIADYVKNNFKDIDKNEDKKISAILHGITLYSDAIEKANAILATEDYQVSSSLFGEKFNLSIELSAADLASAEIIITGDDISAMSALEMDKENVEKGIITPIITIGESLDYKALILENRPAIPEDLIINEGDSNKVINKKNKEIMKLDSLKAHYEEFKYIYDFSTVKESDLNEMIFNTLNVIDAGKIAGTVITDDDAMALAVATIVKNICKGNDMFADVASKIKEDEEPSVIVNGRLVTVRYTTYTAQ